MPSWTRLFSSPQGHTKSASNDWRKNNVVVNRSQAFSSGICMCCKSQVKYKVDAPIFECSKCNTVNDVHARTARTGIKPLTLDRVQKEIIKCLEQTDIPIETRFASLDALLSRAFKSWDKLNASFTSEKSRRVDLEDVRVFYLLLENLPTRTAFTAIAEASEKVLKRPGRRIQHLEDMQFIWIILENPELATKSRINTSIITRCIGLLGNVDSKDYPDLVKFWERLDAETFRKRLDIFNSLFAHIFSKYRESNQSTAKVQSYGNDWRIAATAKVLKSMFAASLAIPQVPLWAFYNTMVDYADLSADFSEWESQSKLTKKVDKPSKDEEILMDLPLQGKSIEEAAATSVFQAKTPTFQCCQYPFILSLGAKIRILEYEARRQMEVKAREAFFSSIDQKKRVEPNLVLRVRRDHIIEDSFREISLKTSDLKKRLRIEFSGEEGVDAGGLRKEWFLNLARELFDPSQKMFVYDDISQLCWFNSNSPASLQKYYLVGVVLGLAVYNSVIIDVNLPPVIYKKLLGYPYTLDDMAKLRPQLANGLKGLLEFKGNVQDTFCYDFMIQDSVDGRIVDHELMPGGRNVKVTKENRKKFVNLYVEYILGTSVSGQFEEFKRGFYHTVGGNALMLFRPEEIELIIRGSEEALDIKSLRAVSVYEGWEPFMNTPTGQIPHTGGNNNNVSRSISLPSSGRGSSNRPPINVERRVISGGDSGENRERSVVSPSNGGGAGVTISRSSSQALPRRVDSNNSKKRRWSRVEARPVKWFWQFFEGLQVDKQRKLLAFITGSDRIPATGAANLVIAISCLGPDCDRFPVSHTCFNQLCLYAYASKKKLENKLWRAVQESEGFDLK